MSNTKTEDSIKKLEEHYEATHGRVFNTNKTSITKKEREVITTTFEAITGLCDNLHYLYGEDDEIVFQLQSLEMLLKVISEMKDDEIIATVETGVMSDYIYDKLDIIIAGLDSSDDIILLESCMQYIDEYTGGISKEWIK